MFPKLGRERMQYTMHRGSNNGANSLSRPERILQIILLVALAVWLSVWYFFTSSTALNNSHSSDAAHQHHDHHIDEHDDHKVRRREDDIKSIEKDIILIQKDEQAKVEIETDPKATLLIYTERKCKGDNIRYDALQSESKGKLFDVPRGYKSIKIIGSDQGFGGMELLYHGSYIATLFPLDDCVEIWEGTRFTHARFIDPPNYLGKVQIPPSELIAQREKLLHHPVDLKTPAKYRIVFSCESSEYFGYQVWANKYGFFHSSQGDATWTRLLTCQEPDDLATLGGIPTFAAPRHIYSKRYSPINKPDVIAKWYASKDRPQEEVIVVIDPDNWLINTVEPYVDKVKKGFGVAQIAYYWGSKRAQELWKKMCLAGCENTLDLVGVPYVLHRDDLEVIAPLWKMYTLMLKEEMENEKGDAARDFLKKLDGTGIEWAAEMWGFNFASAHAGIKIEGITTLQFRDVEDQRRDDQLKDRAMLHMGRAWFPKGSPEAAKWRHTEGKSFSNYGDQVWCKCNYTASTIMPWPYPPGTDMMSRVTLDMMVSYFYVVIVGYDFSKINTKMLV